MVVDRREGWTLEMDRGKSRRTKEDLESIWGESQMTYTQRFVSNSPKEKEDVIGGTATGGGEGERSAL